MVFSSSTFLFVFLPVTLAFYYLIGVLLCRSVKVKNLILLIASLVFYAWGEPVYIILMLISVMFNYLAGRDMYSSREAGREKRVKIIFIFALIFNIGVLGFFKYAGFITDNVGALTGLDINMPRLPLPVGISFYTFQIMSYIIDLYSGKIKEQKSLISFALYISLFPQLIAGPIVKYKDIDIQLTGRKESLEKYSYGMFRFTVGLSKKLLLANTLGAVYTSVQSSDLFALGSLGAWMGIICYTLQIYFDFSGYSDMAIGLGSMFGFSFGENFRYPYTSLSVTDFWRRWHISLSSWFRDYVYIPMGGNRRSTPRVIFNLLTVWFLTGLWHGASWNFVLWGMFYALLLIAEKYILSGVLPKIPKALRYILTMLCVIFGWVLFSAENLSGAAEYLRAMFTASPLGEGSLFLIKSYILPIIVGCFCALPVGKKAAEKLNPKAVKIIKAAAMPLLLAVCIMFMISETYNPFLYFRF